ncbi:hypothetical protein J7E70_33225 [Variovorax paradoxus]|nr:hypothetical protein [Variovorax paradoxus]MBT2305268.1 hypothetical protein [Variovorax paradoxus]
MATDNVRTSSGLADEAEQTAQEALEAAQGYARESGRIAKDAIPSIRSNVEEDAKEIAKDAAVTGRAYARNAVNATGRKIRDFKGQVTHAKDSCLQYIAEEPVRASLTAAATGAVLMTLLLSLTRGSRSIK